MLQDREWRYRDLADSLHMSASEVHGSLKRSAGSKLYNPLKQQPIAQHLLELIIHGLKYIYPAEPGKAAINLMSRENAKDFCSSYLSRIFQDLNSLEPGLSLNEEDPPRNSSINRL
jgi:hypothetical protein